MKCAGPFLFKNNRFLYLEPWLPKVWFPQPPFSLWAKCIGLLCFKGFAAYSYLFLKQNGQGLNKTHLQKREWEIFQTLKTSCPWDLTSSSWLRLRGLGGFRTWKLNMRGEIVQLSLVLSPQLILKPGVLPFGAVLLKGGDHWHHVAWATSDTHVLQVVADLPWCRSQESVWFSGM